MGRAAKTWSGITTILQAAGEAGTTYHNICKASKLNENSVSSQLSTRFRSGEVNILNEDWKQQPKVYVLPEFGGTPYEAFRVVAEAAREGAALPVDRANGEAKVKAVRAGRRVSVSVSIRLNNKTHNVDLDEAIAIHRDLTVIIRRLGAS